MGTYETKELFIPSDEEQMQKEAAKRAAKKEELAEADIFARRAKKVRKRKKNLFLDL